MEIDEKLSYSLFVALLSSLFVLRPQILIVLIYWYRSLQFDPAPRAGEPLVSRRVPDYFLVVLSTFVYVDLRLIVISDMTVNTSHGAPAYCTYSMTQLPLVASTAPSNIPSS
jgi:hypothetical protein